MMESIRSQRGQRKLMLEGYLYCKEKDLGVKTIWKCDRWKKLNCHARIHVKENKVLKRVNSHNHPADAARCEALKVTAEIKLKAMNTRCDSEQIIGAALANITEAVKGQMATINSLRRNIRRLRNQGKGGKVKAESPEEKLTEENGAFFGGEDFAIYDNGEHENRIVIFGLRPYLPLLTEVKNWYAEGTKQSVLDSFRQLYTIYVIKDGIFLPVVFSLVSEKNEEAYIAMCRTIKNFVPNLQPESILTDFEIGAVNAFEKEFPRTRLKGCFFHFTQNILWALQLNDLQRKYDNDVVFAKHMNMLAALAFVPGDDIERGFDNLCSILEKDSSLENVLDHFEDTFIGRPGKITRRRPKYKMDFWNFYSSVAESTLGGTWNPCKWWHRVFIEISDRNHPTVKILESLTDEPSSKYNKQAENSIKTLKAEGKFCGLNSKIEVIVKEYSSGNILEFLSRIASHISL